MKKTITIINGCGSNIASLQFALERLNVNYILTDDVRKIKNASHVILPGVASAAYGMQQLNNHQLIDCIKNLTQPVLGICLGMQLFYQYSAEDNCDCLGIIPGKIHRLPNKDNFTVPHMGWNKLIINRNSPLFNGITDDSYVYYVHSYYAKKEGNTIATTSYSETISAAVQHNNFFGVQFHPEKSGLVGSKIIENFINL
jgi:imidazole glycerol-phosphate synthase subunit HisH